MVERIDHGERTPQAPRSRGVRVTGRGSAAAAAALTGSIKDFTQQRLSKVRAETEEAEEHADRMRVERESSALRRDWNERLQAQLNSYDGSEGGFTEGVLQAYQQDVEQRISGLTSERARRGFELAAVRQGDRLSLAAMEGAEAKRQGYVMRGLREQVDEEATGLYDNPQDLVGAISSIDLLAENAPEGLRDAYRDEARRTVVSAYISGLDRADPYRLQRELEDGRLDEFITAEEKAQEVDRVAGRIRTIEREAETRANRQQRELESHAKNLTTRVVNFYGAGLAPPPELLDAAEQAAADAGLPGLTERMALSQYKSQRDQRRAGQSDAADRARDGIGAIENAFENGLTPSQDLVRQTWADVQASGNEGLVEKLIAIGEQQQLRAEASVMPRDELRTRLNELEASNSVDAEQVGEYTTLKAVSDARERRGGDDNIGWLMDNGQDFTPVDLGSETLATDVARRVSEADAVAQQTGEKFQVFAKSERARLTSMLNELPADERAGALGRIMAGAGPRAGALIQEIGRDAPELGQAAYLTATGRGAIAAQSFRGHDLAREDSALEPTKGDMEAVERDELAGAIPASRIDVRQSIASIARGAYMEELARRGKSGDDFDADDYRNYVRMAAGRSGETGGIAKVNGRSIQLPAHMTAVDVQGLLSGMSASDWNHFSLNGAQQPLARNEAGELSVFLTPQQLKRSYLVSVGEGRYHVSLTDPRSGASYVEAPGSTLANPRPFVLDLSGVNPEAVRNRRQLERAQQAEASDLISQRNEAVLRGQEMVAEQQGDRRAASDYAVPPALKRAMERGDDE